MHWLIFKNAVLKFLSNRKYSDYDSIVTYLKEI